MQRTPVEQYVRAAKAEGCPPDQLRNFLRAGLVLQPRQLRASAAARQADAPDGPTEIGYGGARGGGKSHWMLGQMGADDCQRQDDLKCLMLRKVGSAVKEGFEDMLPRILGSLPYTYKSSKGVLLFPNDSRIVLGHFKDEKDIDRYLGLEYDVIGIEEATTLSASKVQMIRTTNRTSKANWRPRMYYTTNPGGIGHAWFKAKFLEPYRRGTETGTRFVPATVRDNRFLNSTYVETLESLTGWQKKAWLDGDFDIAAGQYFITWRHTAHVIRPFELPSHWRVWCAFDYGFQHYTVCYLLAEDGDGNVYIVDEHAQRHWLVERHATAIKQMLERHGVTLSRLRTFVAGADVFAKKHTGATVADEYHQYGITLDAAIDDRIQGAAEMLRRLGDVENNKAPRLFVMDRCTRLIDCIPALQHDPHRPEDVLKVDIDEDGSGGDDFYDAARYGLMAATTNLTAQGQTLNLWKRR